jgi:hypothetical protein
MGIPASISGIPTSSSFWAMANFSSGPNTMPAYCSPSLNVQSEIVIASGLGISVLNKTSLLKLWGLTHHLSVTQGFVITNTHSEQAISLSSNKTILQQLGLSANPVFALFALQTAALLLTCLKKRSSRPVVFSLQYKGGSRLVSSDCVQTIGKKLTAL